MKSRHSELRRGTSSTSNAHAKSSSGYCVLSTREDPFRANGLKSFLIELISKRKEARSEREDQEPGEALQDLRQQVREADAVLQALREGAQGDFNAESQGRRVRREGGQVMRIYISGPMTGLPNNNRAAFDAAACRLSVVGHFVINPHDLTPIFGTADEIADSFAAHYAGDKAFGGSLAQCVLDADLAALRSCDCIYLLKGWENSRGTKMELAEALGHNLKIWLEE